MENKCSRCNGTGGVVTGGSCVTCPICGGKGEKEGEVLPSPEIELKTKIKNKKRKH